MQERRNDSFFVKIRAGSQGRLRSLCEDYHLDVFRQTARQISNHEYVVDGLLTREEIDLIRAEHFQVDVLADAREIARARREELKRSRLDTGAEKNAGRKA